MARRAQRLGRILGLTCAIGLALGVNASSAWATANVRMMPDTDGSQDRGGVVSGDTLVVWGNTDFANGSAFTIDFGDGSPVLNGFVGDKSYIATTHVYTAVLNATDYTASLTVGGETETATVRVFLPTPTNSAETIREIRVGNAIRDGLRSLYVNQSSRAATFATSKTSWASSATHGIDQTMSATSLAVLAFENHGFNVNDDPNKAIYQAVIQRGLNFIFDKLGQLTVTAQAAGDPCVSVSDSPAPCVGLKTTGTRQGYATSIASFAVAGAVAGGAGANVVAAGLGASNAGFVAGKTYSEILQRQINAIAWGQSESASAADRGGWRYSLNFDTDGSAIGWAVLAMLDGAAAGATLPAFVATELAFVIGATSCDDGGGPLTKGLGYTTCSTGNVLRTGVALQALALMGSDPNGPSAKNATDYINDAWNAFHPNGELHACGTPSGLAAGSPSGSRNNKGCIYAMFQVFKGLLLNGKTTLPAAAPLPDPNVVGPLVGTSVNWWREYQDYLVANQQNPSSTTGGEWESPQVLWSCCESGSDVRDMTTALAELILSSTVTVVPCSIVDLDPDFETNDLQAGDNEHTVVATVTTGQAPDCDAGPAIAVEVDFDALSGPNAGFLGSAFTDANGQATLTYNAANACPAGQGLDQIQATTFNLVSEVVQKEWVCCQNLSPNTQGFWRRVCKKNHPAQPDRSILTSELCEDLNPDPHSDPCERARAQCAAVVYNVSSERLDVGCTVDATGENVAAAIAAAEALITEGTNRSCKDAQALCAGINEGGVSQ